MVESEQLRTPGEVTRSSTDEARFSKAYVHGQRGCEIFHFIVNLRMYANPNPREPDRASVTHKTNAAIGFVEKLTKKTRKKMVDETLTRMANSVQRSADNLWQTFVEDAAAVA